MLPRAKPHMPSISAPSEGTRVTRSHGIAATGAVVTGVLLPCVIIAPKGREASPTMRAWRRGRMIGATPWRTPAWLTGPIGCASHLDRCSVHSACAATRPTRAGLQSPAVWEQKL
jgi:hypothetical protein